MKKVLAMILSLVMVFTIIPVAVSVSADTDGYYTYSVSNGKATITKCKTYISGDITIPSTLGGCPVTSIGYKAFYNTAYYNDKNNWEDNALYIGKHLICASHGYYA